MFTEKSFKFSGKEVAVVSFIFCLSILSAFWMGYRTGHTVGFDYAQSANLNNIAKYPIDDFAAPELDDESVEEIYARLSDNAVTQSAPEIKNEIPALAPIPETKAEVKSAEPSKTEMSVNTAKETGQTIIANLDALPAQPAEIPSVKVVSKEAVAKNTSTAVTNINAEEEVTAEAPVAPAKKVTVSDNTQSLPAEETKVMAKAALPEIEVKKVEPAPVIEPVKRAKVSTGWYAQVFAPQDKTVADKLAATLKQSGFPVTVESAAGHYRVLVGPESNKQQGQVLLQQLSREKYLPGTPFLKQVK